MQKCTYILYFSKMRAWWQSLQFSIEVGVGVVTGRYVPKWITNYSFAGARNKILTYIDEIMFPNKQYTSYTGGSNVEGLSLFKRIIQKYNCQWVYKLTSWYSDFLHYCELSRNCSNPYATFSTVTSSNILPVIINPTGNPWENPAFMDNEGWPVRLNALVFLFISYAFSRYSRINNNLRL